MPIRMVRFWRSMYDVEIGSSSGSPVIGHFSVPVHSAGL